MKEVTGGFRRTLVEMAMKKNEKRGRQAEKKLAIKSKNGPRRRRR